MKKLISTAVAAGLLIGTSANAAVPAVDRDAAVITEAEGLEGEGGLLIVLLIAAAIAGIIIAIESSEDEDDLPTSP